MRRRDVIIGAASAAAWPLAARAQQRAAPVLGFLHQGAPNGYYEAMLAEFRQGLKQSGFVEGQNLTIDYRWANGQYDRLPGMADELLRRPVGVIAASLLPAALAARAATTTTPIVFNIGSDPVSTGLVASLNRPGGNLTGVSNMTGELAPKRLELLREALPAARVIAWLVNPANPNADAVGRATREAARALGLELLVLNASAERDIDAAFATMAQARVGGLLVAGDAFLNTQSERIIALAARGAIAAMYANLSFTAGGGLMAYGADVANVNRQFGVNTGRVLRGEKPSEIPIFMSTKIELRLNLKTAKALGFSFPLSFLGRAEEVIE